MRVQTGYHGVMNGEEPLSPREAESMGRQTETRTRGQRTADQVVYGDVESVENEDQADAHHAESDEHL
jgi:hypothetical protein